MRHAAIKPAPDPVPFVRPKQLAANLKPDSSDDEVMAAMRADPDVLRRVQAAATAAYEAARMIPSGPIQSVNRYWHDAQQRSLAAITTAGGREVIGTCTAADWTARTAMLRIALAAGEHFRDLVSRYSGLAFTEVMRLRAEDDREADRLSASVVPPSVLAAAPPQYDPLPLLRDLAHRGIHLWASEGGTILARPARALTAQDRDAIRTHKAAILAGLGDEEAVA